MLLDLAAYGWTSPAWSPLYPEDLPEEWRLDYYCNEFSSLVVPSADWAAASIDEAASWLSEAPEGFRFFWELADVDGASRLLELVLQQKRGGGRLAGWLFQAGLNLEHELFEALSRCLPGAAYGQRPVSVLQAEQLAAQGITLCWQEGMELNCRGKGLRVLQIRAQPDMRTLRRIVEEQSAAGVEHLLLLVEPNPMTIPLMRELQTFTDLING